jgi:REP element-mobilizing transposase RayT
MLAGRRILAHHLILSAYGFWAANDLRGSGSEEIREHKFDELGPIHHGRKRQQPTRAELRAFHEKVTPKLEYAPLWFDERCRQIIGDAFGQVIRRCNYTVWECFVGSNHAHLCIRYHRDKYETMWGNLTAQARASLIAANVAPEMHPVWANRPWSSYCYTPDDIVRTNQYILDNATKEGLPVQRWEFVRPYDGARSATPQATAKTHSKKFS